MLSLLCLALALGMLAMVTWNVLAWAPITTARDPSPGAVSVLVPARDEAGTIGECLASVLLITGPRLLAHDVR